MTLRANATFSPTFSLQVYTEPFIASGDYVGFKRVADPRGARLADRFDVVLRWEYLLGSTLFVVWQHGRSASNSDGRFRLGPSLDELFTADASNTFLVKLNYWFSL